MNNAQFTELLNDFWSHVREISRTKGREYSREDEDRLSNFKRHGQALGLTAEKVLLVYASKHWDSIVTAINDLEKPERPALSEPIEGRLLDMIVYMLLLAGLLRDRGFDKGVCQIEEREKRG